MERGDGENNEHNRWNRNMKVYKGGKGKKELKYLGYTFKYINKDDAHIQDSSKRATAAMMQIWSQGDRKFGGDFRKRSKMWREADDKFKFTKYTIGV